MTAMNEIQLILKDIDQMIEVLKVDEESKLFIV